MATPPPTGSAAARSALAQKLSTTRRPPPRRRRDNPPYPRRRRPARLLRHQALPDAPGAARGINVGPRRRHHHPRSPAPGSDAVRVFPAQPVHIVSETTEQLRLPQEAQAHGLPVGHGGATTERCRVRPSSIGRTTARGGPRPASFLWGGGSRRWRGGGAATPSTPSRGGAAEAMYAIDERQRSNRSRRWRGPGANTLDESREERWNCRRVDGVETGQQRRSSASAATRARASRAARPLLGDRRRASARPARRPSARARSTCSRTSPRRSCGEKIQEESSRPTPSCSRGTLLPRRTWKIEAHPPRLPESRIPRGERRRKNEARPSPPPKTATNGQVQETTTAPAPAPTTGTGGSSTRTRLPRSWAARPEEALKSPSPFC